MIGDNIYKSLPKLSVTSAVHFDIVPFTPLTERKIEELN
jgi:hypothetical protein